MAESGQQPIVWRQKGVRTGLNRGSWAYCFVLSTLIQSIARESLSQTLACWVQKLLAARAGLSLGGFGADLAFDAVNQRGRLSGVRLNADV